MIDDLKLLIQNADPEDDDPITVAPGDLAKLVFADLKPGVELHVAASNDDEPIPGAIINIFRVPGMDAISASVSISIYRKLWFEDVGLDVYTRAFSRALETLDLALEDDDQEDSTWVHLRYTVQTVSAPPHCIYRFAVDTYRLIAEEIDRILQPVQDAINKQGLSSPNS